MTVSDVFDGRAKGMGGSIVSAIDVLTAYKLRNTVRVIRITNSQIVDYRY